MQTLKMKIVGYDEGSQSLLVSFASDVTASTDPGSYPAFAFQPNTMWPDIRDIEEIKKRIAVAGVYQAQVQQQKEVFLADTDRVDAIKSLVGQEYTYPVADLLPPDPNVITQAPVADI